MEIECKCVYEDRWVTIGGSEQQLQYACVVTALMIDRPLVNVKCFKGVHLPGRKNDDVKILSFNNVKVEFFPTGVSKIFKKLSSLWVINCGLKQLTRSDLFGLENLAYLDCNDNELTSLPDDLFLNMTKLQYINFDRNKLESLSSKLFSPIINSSQFSYLGFKGNHKINEFYSTSEHGGVQSVDEIMQKIDKQCIKPFVERERVLERENEEFSNTTVQYFKTLWTTKRLSDFVILVNIKEYHVHKIVLSARSSVFAAMFENDMIESQTNQMKIEDFSEQAVEDFLKFLYTGELPEETNALEIFQLAHMYEVHQLSTWLSRICEKKLLENVDESNAFKMLSLGNLYELQELRTSSFEIIKKQHSEFNIPDSLSMSSSNLLRAWIRREIEKIIEKYRIALDKVLNED